MGPPKACSFGWRGVPAADLLIWDYYMSRIFTISGTKILVLTSNRNVAKIQYHPSKDQYCVILEGKDGVTEHWAKSLFSALMHTADVDSFDPIMVDTFLKMVGEA